jgi:hypothetical protein
VQRDHFALARGIDRQVAARQHGEDEVFSRQGVAEFLRPGPELLDRFRRRSWMPREADGGDSRRFAWETLLPQVMAA